MAQQKQKKPNEVLLKTIYSLQPEMYFAYCTKPLEGDSPYIYALIVPYAPYSYLNIGTTTQPANDKSPYLPKTPPPTYMNSQELYIDCNISREQSMHYWKLLDNGKLQFIDEEMIKRAEGVFGELVKKITKSIFLSNSYGLSLPVKINECRSFTDRIADFYRLAPVFLKKASLMSDHLERLKLYTVFLICSRNFTLSRSKTFNPLLGETCQAGLSDGTEIYVEQISHHPPVTSYQVIAKDFTIHGHCQIDAKLSVLGSSEVFQKLRQTLTFKDGQQLTFTVCPIIKMVGMSTGGRIMYMKNKMVIEDKKAGIKSVIFFTLLNEGKNAKRYDAIDGVIYKYKPIAAQQQEKGIKDITDIDTEIARVTGLWTGHIEINGITYWKIENSHPCDVIFANDPLPSDVRFREDLIWLKRKQIPFADAWKDSLELRQRKDKILRQKYFPDYV